MAKKKTTEPAIVAEGDNLAELLQGLIDGSGMTRYAIAKASGVLQSSLSRAYSGETATTFELLKSVANAIGYRVVVRIEKTETE